MEPLPDRSLPTMATTPPPAELLKATAAGDEHAFSHLYAATSPRLFAWAAKAQAASVRELAVLISPRAGRCAACLGGSALKSGPRDLAHPPSLLCTLMKTKVLPSAALSLTDTLTSARSMS